MRRSRLAVALAPASAFEHATSRSAAACSSASSATSWTFAVFTSTKNVAPGLSGSVRSRSVDPHFRNRAARPAAVVARCGQRTGWNSSQPKRSGYSFHGPSHRPRAAQRAHGGPWSFPSPARHAE